jgi:dUTP pyrophosphatase
MNDIKVFFQKLHKDAITPEYKLMGDAGCDLFTIEDVLLKPGDIKLVSTGISIQIPENSMEAQIRSKSGLALKHGIIVLNSPGTIDSGYRGEIKVILANFGKDSYTFKKGDSIGQMVFAFVYRGHFIEVDGLNSTDRGSGGFGHTGLR